MVTRRTRLKRALMASAACVAAAAGGSNANATRDYAMPLSSAIQLLVPPGSFVSYQGTVNTSELVRMPHHGTDAQRLVELLSHYGLQDSVTGYSYSIFPIGSGLPPSPPPSASITAPTDYDSPGFSMALPPPAPAPLPASVQVATVEAVPAKPGQPVNLMNATSQAPRANTTAPPVIVPPPPLPLPVWTLSAGTLISKDLQSWAPQAGWQVQWNFPKDFEVPATTQLRGQFPDVVAQVITALRQQLQANDPQNSNIHADTYTVNHIIVIHTAIGSSNNAD